jgi:hypothetical protein
MSQKNQYLEKYGTLKFQKKVKTFKIQRIFTCYRLFKTAFAVFYHIFDFYCVTFAVKVVFALFGSFLGL